MPIDFIDVAVAIRNIIDSTKSGAFSAKTSLELRAEALRVEVSNEGRWPLSDAQHPLPGHPPWAHEFPLPRTPAALGTLNKLPVRVASGLGGHGVERSDRGHHDAATATSDPLAAEDEPSRPHPVHHQQQVEGESDQGTREPYLLRNKFQGLLVSDFVRPCA